MIEAAIHSRWAATATLVSLVPSERFLTGANLEDSPERINQGLPAASLTIQGSQRHRTNQGYAKQTSARIQVWVRNNAGGVALRPPMDAAFENTEWSVTASGRQVSVIESRIENDYAIEEEDGIWQFIFDLELLHTETEAVEPPEEEPEEEE